MMALYIGFLYFVRETFWKYDKWNRNTKLNVRLTTSTIPTQTLKRRSNTLVIDKFIEIHCLALEGSKSSTHYLGDKNRFDVSSKGPSSGISVNY